MFKDSRYSNFTGVRDRGFTRRGLGPTQADGCWSGGAWENVGMWGYGWVVGMGMGMGVEVGVEVVVGARVAARARKELWFGRGWGCGDHR